MPMAAPKRSDLEAPSDDVAESTSSEQLESLPPSRSRRAFVFFGALAAASAVPSRLRAQVPTRRRPIIPSQPRDAFPTAVPNENVAAPETWASNSARLVRRATMGITRDELARANSVGYQGYLMYQLNYERIDDAAAEAFVSTKYPLLAQSNDTLFSSDARTVQNQLIDSTIYRAAFSKRQLYQRMVEFWSDHFNIDYDKVQYLKVIDDRDVIRKHALGKVSNIVKASAKSAAMLVYLDQQTSNNRAPNQNYARELMELHTLGVDGGYSQNDVAELSRVLTGWTIQGRGNFIFNPNIHDWGAKSVLGVTIPAGSPSLGQDGVKEGETIIDMLVNHPSTARFIATKMLKWLLTPTPSDAQIQTIAAVYRSTKGDIKSMVRAILNDEWLPASPMKLKRPFHFLVSALRGSAPTVNTLTVMTSQLATLGQSLFAWDTPDGYPDKAEYWAGNILPRWNFAVSLSNLNSTESLAIDLAPYRSGTADNVVDVLDQNFFGGEMDPSTRAALLTYVRGGTFNDTRIRETISLALSSNGFQWY
jgi:uncharacterized protein (DUF1800 family)